MKQIEKAIVIALAAASLLSVTGCLSQKVNLDEYTPTAVVTVYGNSSLPWYVEPRDMTSEDDNKTGGMLSGLVNRALGANDPEIQTVNSRIDTAADIINRALTDQAHMTVIDHKVVEDTPIFKSSGNIFFNSVGDNVPAEGYKIIDPNSSKFNRTISKQAGTKSTMFFTFKFQKQKINDGFINKRAAARVTMDVSIANEQGHKILSKEYFAVSTDSVVYVNGKWDKQALCDLYPATIEAVVNQFIFDMTGSSTPESGASAASTADSSITEDQKTEATPIAIPASVKKDTPDTADTTDSTAQ